MVVPTIRIVVGDNYRGALPLAPCLQEVDDIHDESLFVQRIGIAGVAILITRRFQEADGREISRFDCCIEIVDVVLVIGGIALVADGGHRSRTSVRGIGCRRVILERLMVRDVVGFLGVGDERSRTARASRAAVGIGEAEVETALEKSPGHSRLIEQIANVGAAQLYGVSGRGRANVADRIGIAD